MWGGGWGKRHKRLGGEKTMGRGKPWERDREAASLKMGLARVK